MSFIAERDYTFHKQESFNFLKNWKKTGFWRNSGKHKDITLQLNLNVRDLVKHLASLFYS